MGMREGRKFYATGQQLSKIRSAIGMKIAVEYKKRCNTTTVMKRLKTDTQKDLHNTFGKRSESGIR